MWIRVISVMCSRIPRDRERFQVIFQFVKYQALCVFYKSFWLKSLLGIMDSWRCTNKVTVPQVFFYLRFFHRKVPFWPLINNCLIFLFQIQGYIWIRSWTPCCILQVNDLTLLHVSADCFPQVYIRSLSCITRRKELTLRWNVYSGKTDSSLKSMFIQRQDMTYRYQDKIQRRKIWQNWNAKSHVSVTLSCIFITCFVELYSFV